LNYTSDREVAQDVVQETFMDIWSKREKLVITTSINSYLYKVVYYKIMESYRKKKRSDEKLLSYYDESLRKVIESDESYKEALMDKLDICMEELPKRCKKVFFEKKIRGLKSQDIAINLDISLKTIEGHITRAYKFLKDCMRTTDSSHVPL